MYTFLRLTFVLSWVISYLKSVKFLFLFSIKILSSKIPEVLGQFVTQKYTTHLSDLTSNCTFHKNVNILS